MQRSTLFSSVEVKAESPFAVLTTSEIVLDVQIGIFSAWNVHIPIECVRTSRFIVEVVNLVVAIGEFNRVGARNRLFITKRSVFITSWQITPGGPGLTD